MLWNVQFVRVLLKKKVSNGEELVVMLGERR